MAYRWPVSGGVQRGVSLKPHGSSGTARRRSRRFPTHWPDAYRTLVERRIKLIETNKEIGLIEKPEYKRRWNDEPWQDQEQRALRELAARPARKPSLLARSPNRHQPTLQSTAQIADKASGDARVPASRRPLPGSTRLRRGRSRRRTGRGRVGPVPADPAVQAHGTAEAGGLGTHLGSPAQAGRRGGRGRHPGAAQVHHGGFPEDRLLAAPGQARRAQGTVDQLPAPPDRERSQPGRRLGRAGITSSRRRPSSPTTTPANERAGTPSG